MLLGFSSFLSRCTKRNAIFIKWSLFVCVYELDLGLSSIEVVSSGLVRKCWFLEILGGKNPAYKESQQIKRISSSRQAIAHFYNDVVVLPQPSDEFAVKLNRSRKY